MKGCFYVNIEYEGQTGEKPLLIVGGSGSTLGGLLSTLPGRQPSVHAILALRHRHIATMHVFMSCNTHYAIVIWPVIREVPISVIV